MAASPAREGAEAVPPPQAAHGRPQPGDVARVAQGPDQVWRDAPLTVMAISSETLPSLKANDSFFQRWLALPTLLVQTHWVGMTCTILSATLCWLSGYSEKGFLDPIIFKSIFVVFGFTMGFRNVRANQRYFDTMMYASQLYAAWWGIYLPLPTEIRLKIQKDFLSVFEECCAYIHRVGQSRSHAWYGIVGIEPRTKDQALVDGVTSLTNYGATESEEFFQHVLSQPAETPLPTRHSRSSFAYAVISPRPKLLKILSRIEEHIEHAEDWPRHQKLRRGFWAHKAQLLDRHNQLLSLALPSVPDRFQTFIEISLFFFAIAFPWGVQAVPFDAQLTKEITLHIYSGAILICNTTLVVGVLFTLNALTKENEDALSGDSDDIDLVRLCGVLALGVAAFERQHVDSARGSARLPTLEEVSESPSAEGSPPSVADIAPGP